jgi:hypothetical protein
MMKVLILDGYLLFLTFCSLLCPIFYLAITLGQSLFLSRLGFFFGKFYFEKSYKNRRTQDTKLREFK